MTLGMCPCSNSDWGTDRIRNSFGGEEFTQSKIYFGRCLRTPQKQRRRNGLSKKKKEKSRQSKKKLGKQEKQRAKCTDHVYKQQNFSGIWNRRCITSWFKPAGIGWRQQLWKKDRSGNLGSIGKGECGSDSVDSEDI